MTAFPSTKKHTAANTLNKNTRIQGPLLVGLVVKTGAWVQSLLEELRSKAHATQHGKEKTPQTCLPISLLHLLSTCAN